MFFYDKICKYAILGICARLGNRWGKHYAYAAVSLEFDDAAVVVETSVSVLWERRWGDAVSCNRPFYLWNSCIMFCVVSEVHICIKCSESCLWYYGCNGTLHA